MSVTLVNASVDRTPNGRVIVRGSIVPRDLGNLLVDEYQREVLGDQVHNKLIEAIVTSTVPDVELGCRSKQIGRGEGEVTLSGPTYIIDGLQRISAAKLMIERGEQGVPYIGAVVFMETTPEWERERFRALNMDRTKLSPNVLLRNMRHDSLAVDILWRLTKDNTGDFVLNGRVNWEQKTHVTDLISAMLFAKTAGFVHSHMGAGRSSKALELSRGLDGIVTEIGEETFTNNIVYFFETIHECFRIGEIRLRMRTPPQLTGTFLLSLARIFDEHEDFWKDNELFVNATLKRKLSKFPITDPNVSSICSGGGRANDMLFMMLVHHMNSGKRSKHLTRRTEQYPSLRTVSLPNGEEEGLGDEQ